MIDQLYLLLGAIAAALAGLWAVFMRGKKAQQAEDKAGDIEAVERANEIARDVDADPDPRQRLRDKWTR